MRQSETTPYEIDWYADDVQAFKFSSASEIEFRWPERSWFLGVFDFPGRPTPAHVLRIARRGAPNGMFHREPHGALLENPYRWDAEMMAQSHLMGYYEAGKDCLYNDLHVRPHRRRRDLVKVGAYSFRETLTDEVEDLLRKDELVLPVPTCFACGTRMPGTSSRYFHHYQNSHNGQCVEVSWLQTIHGITDPDWQDEVYVFTFGSVAPWVFKWSGSRLLFVFVNGTAKTAHDVVPVPSSADRAQVVEVAKAYVKSRQAIGPASPDWHPFPKQPKYAVEARPTTLHRARVSANRNIQERQEFVASKVDILATMFPHYPPKSLGLFIRVMTGPLHHSGWQSQIGDGFTEVARMLALDDKRAEVTLRERAHEEAMNNPSDPTVGEEVHYESGLIEVEKVGLWG